LIYLRADGMAPASDPVANQQFEMDRTILVTSEVRRQRLELAI